MYCWAGYGGLYKLGCHRSLTLVKGEGKASGACAGGACVDGACVGGACVGRASVDGACVGGACADGDYADEACMDGVCADRAYIGGRSFKTARARARAVDSVKGVNKHNLRR